MERYKEIERSIIKKFHKDIWRKFTKAINDYELVEDGDRIAVCISGGKDSMLMAKLFQELSRHGKKNFEAVYLVMDPGYNQQNRQKILENAELLKVPVKIFSTQIFNAVVEIEKSPCYLCARMRRGYLYNQARELGCNKIALGHHFDDVIETILMGMLYGGQVQTMMPKLHSTNFKGMELIRPLYLVREEDIIHWAGYNGLSFLRCACRFTEQSAGCEDKEQISKRKEVKELIRELRTKSPFIEKNIFRSVENVNLDTIIAYKKEGRKHYFLEGYREKGEQRNMKNMEAAGNMENLNPIVNMENMENQSHLNNTERIKNSEELIEKAFKARENAYAPYSGFRVGACIKTRDGQYIFGANIENAAYGSTNCAERSAVFSAYSQGYRRETIEALAIVTEGEKITTPCGACRQVLSELLNPDTPIFLSNGKETVNTSIAKLLPDSFGSADLEGAGLR